MVLVVSLAPTRTEILSRNDVHVSGVEGGPAIVLGPGFGCDQTMWAEVTPAFEQTHRVVLFDHVGSGASDLTAYDPQRHGTLDGYARDLLEILAALELTQVTFVGHSVSAMIGVLAANAQPGRIARLIMIGGSPRYVDDTGYVGGLSRSDVDDLLEALDVNYAEWSRSMAPVAMGTPDRPDLEDELEASFLRGDNDVARRFAHVTFLCDHRADVARVTVPTLILQSADDAIVPRTVAEYLHEQIAGSRLVVMQASGHYPHLSGPDEVARHIREFL